MSIGDPGDRRLGISQTYTAQAGDRSETDALPDQPGLNEVTMYFQSAVGCHRMHDHLEGPSKQVGEAAHVGPEATSPVVRLVMLQDALQLGIAVGGRSLWAQ